MEIITIGISPNTQSDDVTRALKALCMPWRWYQEDARNQVISWFKKHYPSHHLILFSSGRSALTAILTSFGIGHGDEVILQAFTCMVVPNAIRITGAAPVYADIDKTANIDPSDLEKKITSRTKAIIVQHTFGTPADMDSIMGIAHTHHVLVIEDCAHALGAVYKGKKVGTIGDGAIFSFGRDKIISSVFGGAAIVNPPAGEAGDKLKEIEKHLSYPSVFWIIQQLLHPILMSGILPLYKSGIGKFILVVLQKLHLLSFPVSKIELAGGKPKKYMLRYPNALAYMLIGQLEKLDRYAKNRQNISLYYEQELKKRHIPYLKSREQPGRLRFGVVTNDQKQILGKAKQQGILLGNWYHNVVDPIGSDLSKSGYIRGSCPKAELLAQKVINLPTRITKRQADEVVQLLQRI